MSTSRDNDDKKLNQFREMMTMILRLMMTTLHMNVSLSHQLKISDYVFMHTQQLHDDDAVNFQLTFNLVADASRTFEEMKKLHVDQWLNKGKIFAIILFVVGH